MSENLALLSLSLQVLIYKAIFNENLGISIKNSISMEPRRKTKTIMQDLVKYREIETKKSNSEQIQMKKIADTLILKSQMLPSKRSTETKFNEKLKKSKRETVRVMNEDLPVYKTTKFIDEYPVVPIFSREETMPKMNGVVKVPAESKKYLEIELRIIKISKPCARVKIESIQKIILSKTINS